jgi:tetratricopeptide (TPR) repeat protein
MTKGFRDVQSEIAKTSEAATKKLSEKFDELIYEQREAFQAITSGLYEVASAIEWGFSELSWQIQQQTDVLREISRKMDIPSQIQATEWRRMAEELRVRGVYDKSLEFFLKARETNPLDYQIYIGLGRTYLCLAQFEEAGKCFLDSLPHAPRKGNFDYESYSFRLVARTKYCGMNIDSAISYVEQAVSLSPNYWKAYYDLAQYCTIKGDLNKSADALRKAIEAEKLYFPMAENERDFAPIRNILENIRNEVCYH